MSEAVYRDQEYLPALAPDDLLRVAKAATSGIRDPHDQEDAASDFVVAALVALQRAEPGRPVRAYQHKSGRGAVASFLQWNRKHHRREPAIASRVIAGEGDDTMDMFDVAADTKTPDPTERVERTDTDRAVRQAVEALPEPLRRVIDLRHLNGRSWQQVSEALALSKQGARLRHERAMIELRKLCERAGLRPS